MRWRLLRLAFLFVLGGILAPLSQAETIRYKLPSNNLVALAKYEEGDHHRPAVLILHGLFSTNAFPTVRAMMESAEDLGLGVLAPNLTYAIPERRQSVMCTTLHHHTLNQDVAEIHDWIDWLHRQGYPGVILVGHSTASQLFLHALRWKPRHDVRGVILTSLFYFKGQELGTVPAELKKASSLIARHDTSPQTWHFAFCHGNYLATAQSYFSYMRLSRPYILKALHELSASTPTWVIIGGTDKRLRRTGRNLLDQYRQSGAHLIIIKGANHFFSSEHEFDLQDRLSEILQTLATHP